MNDNNNFSEDENHHSQHDNSRSQTDSEGENSHKPRRKIGGDDDESDYSSESSGDAVGIHDLKDLDALMKALMAAFYDLRDSLDNDVSRQKNFTQQHQAVLKPQRQILQNQADPQDNILFKMALQGPGSSSNAWLVKRIVEAHPEMLEELDGEIGGPLFAAVTNKTLWFIDAVLDSDIKEDDLQAALGPVWEKTSKNCVQNASKRNLPAPITIKMIEKASKQTLAAQDSAGCSPLHTAVEYTRCTRSHEKVILKLIECDSGALDCITGKPDFYSVYQHHVKTRRTFLEDAAEKKKTAEKGIGGAFASEVGRLQAQKLEGDPTRHKKQLADPWEARGDGHFSNSFNRCLTDMNLLDRDPRSFAEDIMPNEMELFIKTGEVKLPRETNAPQAIETGHQRTKVTEERTKIATSSDIYGKRKARAKSKATRPAGGGKRGEEPSEEVANQVAKALKLHYLRSAFLGCPHECSDGTLLRDELYQLFRLNETADFTLSYSLACSLAQSALEINEDFLRTQLYDSVPISIVISTAEEASQRIFSDPIPWTTAGSARKWSTLKCPVPHWQLARGFELVTTPEQARSMLQTLRAFTSTKTDPVQPFSADYDTSISRNPQIVDWTSASGTASLVVQTVSPVKTANSICKYIQDSKISSYFLFDFQFYHWDCRFDSVKSLLRSLLNSYWMQNLEVKTIQGKLIKVLEERSKSCDLYHELNLEDLWALVLEVVRLTGRIDITLVLLDLNERIRSHRWLLDKITTVCNGSDLKFQVLFVTGHVPCPLFKEYDIATTAISTKNIIDGTVSSNATAEKDDDEKDEDKSSEISPHERVEGYTTSLVMLEMLRNQPRLHTHSRRIAQILRDCAPDKDLQAMISTWLVSSNLHFDNVKLSSLLADLSPITPQKIFQRILATVVVEQGEPALEALQLVTSTFRPLSIHELEILHSAKFHHRGANSVICTDSAGLTSLFRGLLVVRKNEVKFGHPLLREFLSPKV
ncbi:hypothetical protein CC80DRAFT_546797 [Byssothecium circinans]|uniref:Uncharacterized protein n=1 Tax=Byssothecium circinans TaxID=147558 RepID=A0A6A5U1L1_9PLEO|nr:hypothetical protein CC80DRAFT_546797 [Byssothecium circinans]